MSHLTNRRRFLQASAATGVGLWIAGGVRAEEKENTSPNDRIAFACIGVGGKGSSDSEDAAKAGDVVAICDVDETFLEITGKNKFPKAKKYTDYRKMLDEMGDHIDAVTISTPDHHHTSAALMAMRMGKHCFCQKPLTRTIYEARLMAQVAREQNVATQMGNQHTASSSLRRAAAVIKSGALGKVSEVHVWTNRPVWPQGNDRAESIPCPKNLDWNLWLGPAPVRPYANGYHRFAWRGWWDFGTGALGDMACHTVNLPYMALNLKDPVAVQAETSGHNGDYYPKWSIINFEFPELDGRPPVKFTWYDGGKRPDAELFEGETINSSGCLVVGDKAKLYAPGDYAGPDDDGGPHFIGGGEMPEVKWVESPGHFDEFVRAIRGGEPAVSNFPDYAGKLTEVNLLGNLAVWVAAAGKGERVEWDAEKMISPNTPGLETIIKPIYRPGYTLDLASTAHGVPMRRPRRRIFDR
ncbi:MAG: Gfo/Idh/MocA family oxidoreductase [Pirellulales bacterium]|nr:Gfo/Idh/MocA family oxidoreductase [Pirellulales bacterium]